MAEYEQYEHQQAGTEEEEEDANTTTVQFIAVSADEHERMIREGELPATIQVCIDWLWFKFRPQPLPTSTDFI